MQKPPNSLKRQSSVLVLFFTLLSLQHAYAQSTINGKITDETGVGIPGANVLIQGTSTGSVADVAGDYRIEASSSDTL